MRALMPVFMSHPTGHSIGDANARDERNKMAAQVIRVYNMANLLPRAQVIEQGTDKEMDKRLRDSVQFADKV